MILIIGGLGFVGSNTTQALLDVGEDCVLTQHKSSRIPEFLEDQVGKRIFIEPLDVADASAFNTLGLKYKITGIVDLVTGGIGAGPGASALDLTKDIQTTVTSIATVLEAAHDWNVKRVSFASAPVVYNGAIEFPWREDQPLPLTAAFSMEAAKKIGEILTSYLSRQTQVECIEMRLAAIYGPNYDATRGSLVARLVHAAVKGEKPSLEGLRGSIYAADGGDQCYVKDTARAIALLQTADKLNHQVYNISSGRPTTNQAVVDAIKKVFPDFRVELPRGHAPSGPKGLWYYDTTRLCKDTGFEPKFDIEAGLADYIAWLQTGNER